MDAASSLSENFSNRGSREESLLRKTNGEFNWPDQFLRIGSLARRRAKQPASADWLHNARGRFYFQIAYYLFRVPRLSSRVAQYLSRSCSCASLSIISALLWLSVTRRSNFEVDTPLLPPRCSGVTLIETVKRRRYFIFPVWRDYRRCPLTVGSSCNQGRRWMKRTLRKNRKDDKKKSHESRIRCAQSGAPPIRIRIAYLRSPRK